MLALICEKATQAWEVNSFWEKKDNLLIYYVYSVCQHLLQKQEIVILSIVKCTYLLDIKDITENAAKAFIRDQ